MLAVAALLALAAAGCGGDDDEGTDASATEWADGVCSAITTWTDSITSAADSLSDGDVNENSLQSTADDLESATSDFVDDLRGLGRPDTEAGEEAQQALDELAGDVEDGVETMKSAVDDASGTAGVVQAITAVGTALSTLASQVSSAFEELEGVDADGELEDAFSEADSCDELEN
jgi:hypothetical protein